MILTQERLKELLHYDQETGVFVWRSLPSRKCRVKVGDIAGGLNSEGYWRIKVCGVLYLAHRLAWFWMTGAWPDPEVDHRNGIHDDNRWKNLREANRTFNAQNQRRAHRDNKAGFLGVQKRWDGFLARIVVNGKKRDLGNFPTPELAHAAYLEAKRDLHPGCAI